MRILVSNDDGYQALGINYLADMLSEIAEVVVIAPDRNRSGASNSLTIDMPVRIIEAKKDWYYVNGTPTDCVHMAVTGFLDKQPDMVISGINHGPNLGDDVLYSGTVSAALEGRFLGLPSIAVSLAGENGLHFDTAARVTKELVLRLVENPLPAKTILNVNVPDLPFDRIGEFEVTRLGTRHVAQPALKQVDPRGHDVYWMGPPGEAADAGPGTDFYAVRAGHVSITPMQVEWTNYEVFENVSSWTMELNNGKKCT